MNRFLRFFSTVLIIATVIACVTITPTANADSASGSIVMEVNSGRVLYSENEDKRLPMASTTKILTALVVLEHCALSDIVKVPREGVGIEGSSIYLKEGDDRTVEELLFGLMLRSGNDAAVTLALHTAGSIESFSALMNERAREIGAINSNFVNPHGLHDDAHFTTAYDLALISCEAMKNFDFKRIVSSRSAKFEERVYYNKNKMLSSYDGATGIKTGYTKRAGRCLVSSSSRNGMEVVCVTLNCYQMWEQSKALMDQAHNTYKMYDLLSGFNGTAVDVEGGICEKVEVDCVDSAVYPLKNEEINKISYEIDLVERLKAPVKIGEKSGKINVFVDNCLIFSKNLYTINHVRKKGILDWLKEIS